MHDSVRSVRLTTIYSQLRQTMDVTQWQDNWSLRAPAAEARIGSFSMRATEQPMECRGGRDDGWRQAPAAENPHCGQFGHSQHSDYTWLEKYSH